MARLRRLAARLLARPALAAAALYALLAVAFLGQALTTDRVLSSSDYLWTAAPWSASAPPGVRPLGANGEQADSVAVFQPFAQYTREAMPGVPLWNPHVAGGRPYVANAQSAVFTPFNVPAYVAGDFWQSLEWSAALKLWVAAFGTFLLGRALGMRPGGALLAGLAFGFGLFYVLWLPWPLTAVWAWLPWLLLLTEHVVRRPGPLPAAGLAAVVALQFLGGHPESSFHVLFATLAFLVLRVAMMRRQGRAPWRKLARLVVLWAAALVGGAALAGLALAPFLELLARSGDLDTRGDPIHVPRKYVLGVLLPDYWGRPTGNALEGFMVERGFYAGALPTLLAGTALILRPTFERVAIAVFAALALGVTIGVPGLFEAVTRLPGFATAHNTRLPILFLLCVALLAGWGLDDVVARRATARRGRAVLGFAAAVVALPPAFMAVRGRLSLHHLDEALDVAWGFATPPTGRSATGLGHSESTFSIVQQAALLEWLALAGAGLGLLALGLLLRRPAAAGAFVALALGLTAVDVFRTGMGQNPAIPRAHAVQPATGAARYLQSRRPARFAGLTPSFGVVPLPADVAMRYDLYDARGYDYPVERRYDRTWRRYVAPMPGFAPPTTLASADGPSLRVLSLFGVTDLLQQRSDPPISSPGLRVVYDGPDARVYANDRAVPRAVVVGAQRVVDGEEQALAAIGSPGFDARREAIVERRVAGLGRARGAGAAAGRARIVAYGREDVTVRASASRLGLLVLSDVHYPGWKATVDGDAAPIQRVNYLFRGVRLDPGEHTVRFHYESASWRAGWIVSLLALAGLCAVLVAGLRGRTRRR